MKRKTMDDVEELPSPKSGIDFESLPWNLNCPDDHKYLVVKTNSDGWTEKHYDPETDTGLILTSLNKYSESSLGLTPATTSLNYGTTIWEGLKCFRMADGRAAIFRPDKNWERFKNGCEALYLPAPSYELFMRGVQEVVRKNGDLVPPFGEGTKLYIRPMMIGSGQQLGLYPSPEFSLVFYVSPTGNYFKGKAVGGLKLHLETKYSRASRGGTGNIKCSGNYAVALRPLMQAKKLGFDDNIFVELETYKKGALGDAVFQELSAANFFLVLNSGEIVTPSLKRETILPGITRASVLELVEIYHDELLDVMKESTGNMDIQLVKASERDVYVKDIAEASEAFVTGTAAEIVPVASVGTGENDEEAFNTVLKHGKSLPGGPVTAKILEILREVMAGKRVHEKLNKWLPDPFKSAEAFRKLEG